MQKNFHGTEWIPVKVTKVTGPLSYEVQTNTGIVLRRHVDHLRRNYSDHVLQEPVEDLFMSDALTPNLDTPAVQVDIPPPAQVCPVAVCHSTHVPRPVDCFHPYFKLKRGEM